MHVARHMQAIEPDGTALLRDVVLREVVLFRVVEDVRDDLVRGEEQDGRLCAVLGKCLCPALQELVPGRVPFGEVGGFGYFQC